MGFYDDMADVANELLGPETGGGFGQGTITLTRVTPGTPNASTPWVPVADSTVKYTLKATAKAVSKRFVDGAMIFATDDEIVSGATMIKTDVDGSPVTEEEVALEVLPSDVVAIDDKVVAVINAMRIPKAGTAVAWRLIVRS